MGQKKNSDLRKSQEIPASQLTAQDWELRYRQLQERTAVQLKEAQDALNTRLLYEHTLSACSQALLASSETEEALTETLYELLVATSVSRVTIFENFLHQKAGNLHFRQTHEMCALNVASLQGSAFSTHCYQDGLERWLRLLRRGQPFAGSLDNLLDSEKAFVEGRGITSLMLLPMWVEGRWYGFIGFEDVATARQWTQDDIMLLQTAVDMVGSFIGRNEAEAALRESEEKYRTLIEQSSDAIFLIYGGRFELVNRRFTELFGVTQEQVRNPEFTFNNIIAPQSRADIQDLAKNVDVTNRHRPPYEFIAIDKDDHEINVELTVSYPLYKRGLATQGIIRDITERKRIEVERRSAYQQIQKYAGELALKIKQEKRQREIATILAEVVASVSLTLATDEILSDILIKLQQLVPYDGAAVYLLNDGVLQLEATYGRSVGQDVPENAVEHPLLQEMVATKSYILVFDTQADERGSHWFGGEHIRSWIGAPLLVAQEIVGYLAVNRDTPGTFTASDAELVQAFAHQVAQTIHNAQLFAELKETQAQLVQRERLAALGQMAATVAHELRNPLMSLQMGVEYLTLGLSKSDPRYRGAELVQSNIDRVVRVTENILFVARTPRLNLSIGSLVELVQKEVEQWAQKLAEKKIDCQLDLPADLPDIQLDFDQMGRVLSNLIGNSLDAMESGGQLQITVAQAETRQVITLADNGAGISVEDQLRIFEPFFTTKSRGTGLGLAIVKQIIDGHNGQIKLWSEPGVGTRFTIELPLAG